MSELEKQIINLCADAMRCAETYEETPGLAGPAAIADLYRSIARLAEIVKQAPTLAAIPAKT